MSPSRVSQMRPFATRTVMPRRAVTLIDWLREICRAMFMVSMVPIAEAPRLRRRSRDNGNCGSGFRDRGPGLLRRPRAKAGVAGADDRLRAVFDLDLVEDVGDIVAHGLLGEIEPRRNLRVIQPLGDQFEDFGLAG